MSLFADSLISVSHSAAELLHTNAHSGYGTDWNRAEQKRIEHNRDAELLFHIPCRLVCCTHASPDPRAGKSRLDSRRLEAICFPLCYPLPLLAGSLLAPVSQRTRLQLPIQRGRVHVVRLPEPETKQQQQQQLTQQEDDESLTKQAAARVQFEKKQNNNSINMIVNSYPYNPSQQQQQRCVGLNQINKTASGNQSSQEASATTTATMNRLLNLSSVSQQNSLYGSSAFDHHQQQQHQHQPMLHDLANLQFDSPLNPIDPTSMSSVQDNLLSARKLPQRSAGQSQDNSQATNVTANNDISLYSPSSSTSLLYHIYDQINLPNDHQTSDANNNNNNNNGKLSAATLNQNKNKSNTTILNPANLFNHQQLPLQMQMQQQQNLHQHQLSQLAEMQKQQQQQQCYSTYQQHPFSTLNPHHHQQQPASYMPSAAQQQNNLMLDSVMRHQRTLQRPLSSSAASSMSGQSIPAYGRHPRQSFIGSHGQAANGFATTTTTAASKSHNNLANVLHANQTLGHLNHPHLIFGATNNRPPMTPPSKHSKQLGGGGGCWPLGCNHLSKQMNQRARSLFYEYRTVVKCSLLLIILAFALLSVIKLTLLTSNSSSPSASISPSQQQMSQYLNVNPATSASSNIFYPPPYHQNQKPDLSGAFNGNPSLTDPGTDEQSIAQAKQDMLKSRLLTGEFVILSQNFSRNPSQRTLMAERIVKLMDQVFLSSPDVKQLYSRTEIISIRGIIVNCNIILNESVAYAPQQFGLALVNSLDPNHPLLASQVGYEIDKNSIKLNSVPDKDLKSGLVPPGLIPPSLIHQLGLQQQQQQQQQQPQPLQPTGSPVTRAPSIGQDDTHAQDALEQTANQVVWSEWSDWSSCVDKNGVCDPARLHSRLRRCIAQHTGDKVDPSQCRQRYSIQDQELEVSECSRSCSAQQLQILPGETHITLSDEPNSQLGPHTASPFLVDSRPFKPAPSTSASKFDLDTSDESTTSIASVVAQQQQQQQTQSSVEQQKPSDSTNDIPPVVTPTLVPPSMVNLQQPVAEVSCSNCTSDEICLLLMQQKVPFCAKIKDRNESCGGWCKGQNQLCQPVGSSAFKCIHDSECLAEEWRCNNSQCIPLSGRCDGHSNCFDNSDEQDCPIKKK